MPCMLNTKSHQTDLGQVILVRCTHLEVYRVHAGAVLFDENLTICPLRDGLFFDFQHGGIARLVIHHDFLLCRRHVVEPNGSARRCDRSTQALCCICKLVQKHAACRKHFGQKISLSSADPHLLRFAMSQTPTDSPPSPQCLSQHTMLSDSPN